MLSSWKIDVDDVLLIEEVRRIAVFVTNARLESWNVNDISTSKRWCEVLIHLRENDISHSQVLKIISFVLCIPGTNAVVKRIFSMMNDVWTNEKTQLSVDTLKGLLMIKANFKQSCSEFHTMLLSNNDLLQAIHFSKKY